MIIPSPRDLVSFPLNDPPLLMVLVDAEEEFQWGTYSPSATSVQTIRDQVHAQRIFERYGIRPTYAVDYPVATQADGIQPLLELMQDGKCEIGTQLHAWVNPPFEETVSVSNTFPCNLPRPLELAKLERLTAAIEQNFGTRPTLYRAGRFGYGPSSAEALVRLGYRIDCSLMPWMDLRPRLGPDHSRVGVTPFWFGPDRSLLELPATVGMVGLLGRPACAGPVHRMVGSKLGKALRLPGLLARMGMLDRIPLTPEGTSLEEARKVTRWLYAQGLRTFTVTYHSPSLAPGHTPYVRNQRDLDAFLYWLESFLDFFFSEMNGQAATPGQVLARAQAQKG